MKKFLETQLVKYVIFIPLFVLSLFISSDVCVSAGELNMHTLNIGRGDSILIESNGHYMLVDAGTSKAAPKILEYLEKFDIPENKIDYIVSTHPDGDHVGSFTHIFEKYDIGQIFYSPCPKASNSYNDFIASVKEEGSPFRTPIENETWQLGDALVEVVYDGSQGSTYNECSIVLKVTCDDKSILLTGDLPSTMETSLIQQGYNFKADILKIGHHGAAASSCASFLDAVNAQYAVISCDTPDKTDFPKASVLKRLARRFVKTYRTPDSDVVINIKNGVISTSNKENNGYISIKRGKITLSNNVFYATGSAIKPTVSLYVNGVLVPATDYTVKYSSNKKTGVAKVKLSGTEAKYVSSCSTTFLILPKTETLKGSVKHLRQANLSWSYQSNSTGYTIIYTTDSSFKTGLKYININNPKTIKYTIPNLAFGTKYYFKIRAYKSNVGYGNWSNTIKIKTKKIPLPSKGKITNYKLTKNKIKLQWKKLSSKYNSGYLLQYSTSKNFKNAKKITTIKYTKTSKNYRTLKNLKRNTTYYIRILGYNNYGYGKWSEILKVKTKKLVKKKTVKKTSQNKAIANKAVKNKSSKITSKKKVAKNTTKKKTK